MKTFNFSDEEVNALCALLDIAVKAGGINVAEAALFLTKKLKGVEGGPQMLEPTGTPNG